MDAVVVPTAQNVDLAFAPAGLGDRLVAWLVDALIGVAYVLALSALGLGDWPLAAITVAFLPLVLYHLLCEVLLDGQSLGKKARKIQVARLDGAPPTLGQYGLRWALRWVDVTLSSGLVAVVTIGVTGKGQRLGDVAAGTTVIRQQRRVALLDVRYPTRPRDYAPTFPEAERLSDADVRTLRAVLVRLDREPGARASLALGRRAQAAVEKKLGVRGAGRPAEFLRAVILDYTVAHDRYGDGAGA